MPIYNPQDGPGTVVPPTTITNPNLPPVDPNGSPTGVTPPAGWKPETSYPVVPEGLEQDLLKALADDLDEAAKAANIDALYNRLVGDQKFEIGDFRKLVNEFTKSLKRAALKDIPSSDGALKRVMGGSFDALQGAFDKDPVGKLLGGIVLTQLAALEKLQPGSLNDKFVNYLANVSKDPEAFRNFIADYAERSGLTSASGYTAWNLRSPTARFMVAHTFRDSSLVERISPSQTVGGGKAPGARYGDIGDSNLAPVQRSGRDIDGLRGSSEEAKGLLDRAKELVDQWGRGHVNRCVKRI